MALGLPHTIGKFSILQSIGEGGMGRLYLGRDPDMDRLVAIKLLREEFDTRELRERFSREARSISTLRHPNIVTIFETGTHDGQPFIVMEYIQGETLSQIIRSGTTLPLERKLQMMDELCAGLHYAHRKNVVHRDIKPANLMIDEEGVLRILDFGIARLGASGLTQAGTVIGTLNYMSPEQLAGRPVDGRADMFSAAAVFYELLSSQPVVQGEVPGILHKIINEDPEPLERLCPDLDAGLVAFVNRCLKKAAADRYPDLGATREALAVIRKRLATTGGEPMVVVPSLSDRGELRRIRAEQIKKHVDTARHAIEVASYERALQACQQALLLDPENEQALDLGERARAVLEHQQLLRQWLAEANEALGRGAVTAASVLIDRALSLNPDSEEARSIRRAVDAARRQIAENEERARSVEQALARARTETESGSFDAAMVAIGEVFAVDPANEFAQELSSVVVAARATRQAESEARAQALIVDLPLQRPTANNLPVTDIGMLPERTSVAPPQQVRRPWLLMAMAAGALVLVSALAVWRWTESRATRRDPSATVTAPATAPATPTSSPPAPPAATPSATPVPSSAGATPETIPAPAEDPRPNPTPVPPAPAASTAISPPAPRVPARRAGTPIEAPVAVAPASPRATSPEPSSERPPVQTAPSPPPPSTAPGVNEGQWIVRVDANCAGMVTTVDLFIDDVKIGTVTPGRGVVKNVQLGSHTVSALSPSGHSWGPLMYDLTAGVRTTSLSCD